MSGAGIKTLRWQTKKKPDVNAIAEMINSLDCVKSGQDSPVLKLKSV